MSSLGNFLRQIASYVGPAIPRRPLGKTGLDVTIIGLGGESILKLDPYDNAVNLVRSAAYLGINYFDTAPEYYPSEIRVGDGLQGIRKNVILASKTEDRTYDGSWASLEKSLKNLKTDYLDIWQIHHIDHMDEVNQVFGPNGALKALQEAKEQGVVKFLGITSHYDPEPVVEAVRRFPFDTALVAVNAADVHKNSFIKGFFPEATKQGIGVIAMKTCARGRIFEPTALNSMKQALDYVWTLPVSTAIIGHDNIKQLAENIMLAKEFQPLTPAEMEELENKTKNYANLALYFRKGFEKFNPFWKPYGFK
jgi:aryl-alcohol dehydrogenase-like predicted oxidoreductase